MSVSAELEALWADHQSGWKRLLSPHWIREIRLRAAFEVEPLSPALVENQVPPGSVPDCARCENICCIGWENIVSLRLQDIALLLDHGHDDLICRKKSRFPPELLKTRPQLAELQNSLLWQTLPVLRQLGANRICAALTDDLKCSLYPHWPSSCARFPYTLRATQREVIWGTRCPSKVVGTDYQTRSHELFESAVSNYNARIQDAVLIVHARDKLHDLGIGKWLIAPDEDPFDPKSHPQARLPIIPS